jgi:hypothetical protein
MTKAAQLAKQLEHLDVDRGIDAIEAHTRESLHFDVIDDVMCIMHSDGSVNMITQGAGAITVETISAANTLKALRHYRPFKDVFKTQLQ